MTPKTRWTLAGGALALAALLAWAFAPRPADVEVATATSGRYEQTVDEDGRTRLRDRYTVTAPLAGRLARIALHEGDVVNAGAPLALLTPLYAPMLDERTRREQAARIDAAAAGVQRAVAGVERARVGLEQARLDLQRSEQLAAQGFVAPTKLDADRLSLQAAQKELDAAASARQVAAYELETARAALRATDGAAVGGNGGAAFAVRAPVAGRVLKVLQPSETTVALGTPLLDLGDTAQIEVLAELLTTDALQAAPGAPVRIERWGGPGTLDGRVRLVEPGAFTKVSALGVEEQRVNVLITLTSPRERWAALGDGYRVGVRIVTRAQDGALLVPTSAVFPRPGGEGHAVFVVEAGRARLQAVELGGRNGRQAWIKSGLAAGAQVIVYPGSAVADGTRVRVRTVATN